MFFCTFYNHIYWIRYHGLILESLNIESHLIIRILEPLDSNPPPHTHTDIWENKIKIETLGIASRTKRIGIN